jgi:hypothetical protein
MTCLNVTGYQLPLGTGAIGVSGPLSEMYVRAVAGAEVSHVVQLFSNPTSGSYRARRLRALVRALEARDSAPVLEPRRRAGHP